MSFHDVFFDDQAGHLTGTAQAAELPQDHALFSAAVARLNVAMHQLADQSSKFTFGHN